MMIKNYKCWDYEMLTPAEQFDKTMHAGIALSLAEHCREISKSQVKVCFIEGTCEKRCKDPRHGANKEKAI